MKRRAKSYQLTFILIGILFLFSCAEPTVSPLYDQAANLYQQGRYYEVIPLAKQVLDTSKTGWRKSSDDI